MSLPTGISLPAVVTTLIPHNDSRGEFPTCTSWLHDITLYIYGMHILIAWHLQVEQPQTVEEDPQLSRGQQYVCFDPCLYLTL